MADTAKKRDSLIKRFSRASFGSKQPSPSTNQLITRKTVTPVAVNRPVSKWSRQQLVYWLEDKGLRSLVPLLPSDEENPAPKQIEITPAASMFSWHPTEINLLTLQWLPPDKIAAFLGLPSDNDLRKLFNYDSFIKDMAIVQTSLIPANDLLNAFSQRIHRPDAIIPLELEESEEAPSTSRGENPKSKEGISIIEYLKLWLQFDGYHEMGQDPVLLKNFNLFCELQVNPINSADAKLLKADVKARLKQKKKEKKYTENAPEPIKPSKSSKELGLVDIHPKELARQMTLMEETIFIQIRPREFMKQAWNKQNHEKNAPFITLLTRQFNKLINWVTTEVLIWNDAPMRAEVITKFIKVAKHLEKLKNYNGVMQILSSLHSSAISRLKQSWALISPKHKAHFDRLTSLMSNLSNFRVFRDTYAAVDEDEPCIPFIAVFLTDCTYLDDTMQDKDEKMRFNWDKYSTMANKIREIRRFGMRRYDLIPVHSIQSYIQSAESWNDNKTIYAISQLAEGTNTDGGLGSSATNSPFTAVKKTEQRKAYSKFNRITVANMNLRTMYLKTDSGTADSTTLNQRDWKVLLTGAILRTYTEGQVILGIGILNDRLFRIKSGMVKVYKSMSAAPVATMGKEEMFGEISVLLRGEDGTTTAAIVAAGNVEIWEMSVDFVLRMCEGDHLLSEKLHRIIAVKLASRLRALNTTKRPKSKPPRSPRTKIVGRESSMDQSKKAPENFDPSDLVGNAQADSSSSIASNAETKSLKHSSRSEGEPKPPSGKLRNRSNDSDGSNNFDSASPHPELSPSHTKKPMHEAHSEEHTRSSPLRGSKRHARNSSMEDSTESEDTSASEKTPKSSSNKKSPKHSRLHSEEAQDLGGKESPSLNSVPEEPEVSISPPNPSMLLTSSTHPTQSGSVLNSSHGLDRNGGIDASPAASPNEAHSSPSKRGSSPSRQRSQQSHHESKLSDPSERSTRSPDRVRVIDPKSPEARKARRSSATLSPLSVSDDRGKKKKFGEIEGNAPNPLSVSAEAPEMRAASPGKNLASWKGRASAALLPRRAASDGLRDSSPARSGGGASANVEFSVPSDSSSKSSNANHIPSSNSESSKKSNHQLHESVDTSDPKDYQFRKRFRLKEPVILIRQFDCALKGTIVTHGQLYISEKYFCFGASTFGLKTSEVIRVNSIVDIELQKKYIIIKYNQTKSHKFVGFEFLEDAFHFLRTFWEQFSKHSGTNNEASSAGASGPSPSLTRRSSKIIPRPNILSSSSTLQNSSSSSISNVGGGSNTPLSDSKDFDTAANDMDDDEDADKKIASKFEMTPQDWANILKGANLVAFQKGDFVIKEGDRFQRVFQLLRGSACIQKEIAGAQTVLGKLTADDGIFGEISFLEGGSATASIVADEPDTAVYIIEGYFLNVFFERNPGMSGRFYHFLAHLLSKRIKKRESALQNSDPTNATLPPPLLSMELNGPSSFITISSVPLPPLNLSLPPAPTGSLAIPTSVPTVSPLPIAAISSTHSALVEQTSPRLQERPPLVLNPRSVSQPTRLPTPTSPRTLRFDDSAPASIPSPIPPSIGGTSSVSSIANPPVPHAESTSPRSEISEEVQISGSKMLLMSGASEGPHENSIIQVQVGVPKKKRRARSDAPSRPLVDQHLNATASLSDIPDNNPTGPDM